MKRLIGLLIAAVLLLNSISVLGIAEAEMSISADRRSIKLKQNETFKMDVRVHAPDGVDTSITVTCDNDNVTVSKGEHTENKTELTITGKKEGGSIIKAYMTSTPEVVAEIIVIVTRSVAMSDADKEASEKVYYLSDYSFFYYENKDCYVLLFSLQDKNETRIAAPAKVDIRIANDMGVTVYEKTRYITSVDFTTWTNAFYGERYLGSIYIDPDDIVKGESDSGNVYL